MNAFRLPNGTLKLMSLAWRKPLAQTVSHQTVTRASVSRTTSCNYASSVNKPKEEQEQPAVSKDSEHSDPFGIGEVVGSAEKSSILVQGFYSSPDDNKPDSPPSPSKPVSSNTTASAPPNTPQESDPEDPGTKTRLSLYNSWLRDRVNLEATQKSDMGVSESYRDTHYGQIRIDADNPVYSHGHYDDDPPPPDYELRPARRTRLRPPREASKDPITEIIEAGHSVRMRASDFLKQLQNKEKPAKGQGQAAEEENVEEEQLHFREKMVIERIIRPAYKDEPDDATGKEEALIKDSNVIPKQFKLPDYNAITQEDMWNVLRKCVVFQNDFVMAINKPPGVPVHSKARDCRHTVIQFLDKFADLTKCEKIYPLHRIDKETTGVLLFAKDPKVATILKEKFKKREVQKVYLGVTKLCPKYPEGSIKIPIGEGKIPGTEKFRQVLRPDLRDYGIRPTTRRCVEAITDFKVLNSLKEVAFVEIKPVTGYKHQIRVHFGMGLGCPIIGDHKYSHRDKLAPQRLHPHVLHRLKLKQSKVREIPLHLHCNKISFTMPKEFTDSTEPIHIHANIPYYMKYTLKRLGLIS